MRTAVYTVVRPWAVLKVQIKEAFRGLLNFNQQVTYSNVKNIKLIGLAWSVEYLCIARLERQGGKETETVVFMLPGAELEVERMRQTVSSIKSKLKPRCEVT